MSSTATTPKVSWGPSSIIGVALALTQYAGAVAVFAESNHDNVAIVALATATSTLVTTIAGRMYQAGKAVEAEGNKENRSSWGFPPPINIGTAVSSAQAGEPVAVRLDDDDEDEILPAGTDGEDPEYEGRDGTLESRRLLEQHDLGEVEGLCS